MDVVDEVESRTLMGVDSVGGTKSRVYRLLPSFR